jgi:hypothetical protein
MILTAQPASVPAGTRVEAKLQTPVQTGRSKIGDGVVAVLIDPIRSANGIVVPKGSRLNGRVETVEAATRTNEGRVRLVFREIEFPDGRHVSTWITDSFGAAPSKRNRRYLIYMAAGGSFGALIAGKAARIAGILGGALGGFIIADNSGNAKLGDLTLRSGQALHLELGEDLTLK